MSARNSTVAAPWLMCERSAYSRPLMLRWSSAKLRVPMIRNLPSVLMSRVTRPLNTSLEVYCE